VARRLQASLSEIGDAVRALRAGKLVAFPTETVYGLGGDATSDRAVAAIFAAKGRPSFNPLIVHVTNISSAAQFAELSAKAQAVARSFWPGPLTLVLPRRRDCRISLLATAGLDSVAIRVPAHKIAQTLLMMAARPPRGNNYNQIGRPQEPRKRFGVCAWQRQPTAMPWGSVSRSWVSQGSSRPILRS